ncbi:hypothetical protein [Paraburkholderia caribensis]|uniref:hypothetical protein n=1 Tax=Paraburkholderia caribensis TaxID=75105 RepID=UPI00285D5388|nr:hypothetical protein [Paraburkholderia caribensis]MDR6381791.1 hypothetical protein [Paraburkholderia caribensis]
MFRIFRRSGSGISRERVMDLQLEALQSRNARRQQAAKAALVRRGVQPRVVIGRGWVPENVARNFAHMNVRGLL